MAEIAERDREMAIELLAIARGDSDTEDVRALVQEYDPDTVWQINRIAALLAAEREEREVLLVEALTDIEETTAGMIRISHFDDDLSPVLVRNRDVARAALAGRPSPLAEANRKLREVVTLAVNTIQDLRRGFAKSVDPNRWVDQLEAPLRAALREAGKE